MTTLPYASHLHHPSHPHCLELSDLSNLPAHAAADLHLLCSGCRCQASGLIYSCERCNFALHAPCAHMLPLIAHPGHETHPLKLLAAPTYARGRFDCNGCGQRGSGFSYHCAECSCDLHIVCASKPLRIHDQSHCHELHLTFNCPYEIRGFNCNVCRATGGDHWMYRCSYCNFDVHLECAKARSVQAVTPTPPRASSVAAAQPVYIPSGSNPQYQYQTPTVLGQRNMQGVIYNPYNHNALNIGSSQHQAQPIMWPPATGFRASPLVAAAERGLVQGIAQQVGQDLVQDVTGVGSGNGGGVLDFSSFLDFC